SRLPYRLSRGISGAEVGRPKRRLYRESTTRLQVGFAQEYDDGRNRSEAERAGYRRHRGLLRRRRREMSATVLHRDRTMNKPTVILALLMAAVAGPAVADDYAAGKEKAATCAACHGPEGNKPITPDIPRLAGQYYEYLVHSLKAYRSGARDNAMM